MEILLHRTSIEREAMRRDLAFAVVHNLVRGAELRKR